MVKCVQNIRFIFIVLVITNIIVNYAMEDQEHIKKEATVVNCFLMVTDKTRKPVKYAPTGFHAAIWEHSNLRSTIKDPVISFDVYDESDNEFTLALPLKYCYNLKDESLFQITETEGMQLFRNDLSFKNKPLLLNALCVHNPHLYGETFQAQLEIAKKRFYESPACWVDEKNPHELEDAHIVIKKEVKIPIFLLTTKGKIPGHEIQTELAHGPHGCPNEQAFLELLKENKENHEQ